MADRFHLDQIPPSPGSLVSLDSTESHHLLRVLRARPGCRIRLFGHGREWEAILDSADGKIAQVRVERERTPLPPARCAVTYVLPWLRAGRSESVVQKLTELGASHFIIYAARRDVGHLDTVKLPRLVRTVVEACKQCERADVPAIETAADLGAALAMSSLPPARKFVLAERHGAAPLLSQAIRAAEAGNSAAPLNAALVAAGPEGGLTPEEVEQAAQSATCVSLGPRILRAETAPLVAATLLLAAGGDL